MSRKESEANTCRDDTERYKKNLRAKRQLHWQESSALEAKLLKRRAYRLPGGEGSSCADLPNACEKSSELVTVLLDSSAEYIMSRTSFIFEDKESQTERDIKVSSTQTPCDAYDQAEGNVLHPHRKLPHEDDEITEPLINFYYTSAACDRPNNESYASQRSSRILNTTANPLEPPALTPKSSCETPVQTSINLSEPPAQKPKPFTFLTNLFGLSFSKKGQHEYHKKESIVIQGANKHKRTNKNHHSNTTIYNPCNSTQDKNIANDMTFPQVKNTVNHNVNSNQDKNVANDTHLIYVRKNNESSTSNKKYFPLKEDVYDKATPCLINQPVLDNDPKRCSSSPEKVVEPKTPIPNEYYCKYCELKTMMEEMKCNIKKVEEKLDCVHREFAAMKNSPKTVTAEAACICPSLCSLCSVDNASVSYTKIPECDFSNDNNVSNFNRNLKPSCRALSGKPHGPCCASKETPKQHYLGTTVCHRASSERKCSKSKQALHRQSVCQFCSHRHLPVLNDLVCELLKLIENRPLKDIMLVILLHDDNIYHICVQVNHSSQVLGCLLATHEAIEKAIAKGMFNNIRTYCMIDKRRTEPIERPFKFVLLDDLYCAKRAPLLDLRTKHFISDVLGMSMTCKSSKGYGSG